MYLCQDSYHGAGEDYMSFSASLYQEGSEIGFCHMHPLVKCVFPSLRIVGEKCVNLICNLQRHELSGSRVIRFYM